MRPATVRVLALASAAAIAVSACSGDTPPATPEPSASTTAQAAPLQFADSPVGRQATWFLDAAARGPISADDFTNRFATVFTEAITLEQFNETLGQLGALTATSIVEETPQAMAVAVEAGGQPLRLVIGVDSEERIETLAFTPATEIPPAPQTWEELDGRLAAAAPQTSFLAARVDGDTCESVHAVDADSAQPIGSIFKLYVLTAVAEGVAAGTLSWDDSLTITDELKSWPSGQLQDRESGSEISVREAAELMISISDNTATDLLIDAMGREAVEEQITRTSAHADLNIPLITTKDLFRLKARDYPTFAQQYLALDPAERRAFLTEGAYAELGLPDLDSAADWTSARDIETIEWFASGEDLCAAYAVLQQSPDGAVDGALSINDGGVGLPAEQWSSVWFKGGSEPGVLALAYLAQNSGGQSYVVTVTAADPENTSTMNDPAANVALTQELLSLVQGGFALATQ